MPYVVTNEPSVFHFQIQPIADRVAKDLEIISETFSTDLNLRLVPGKNVARMMNPTISRLLQIIIRTLYVYKRGPYTHGTHDKFSHENPGSPGTKLKVFRNNLRFFATLSAIGCTSFGVSYPMRKSAIGTVLQCVAVCCSMLQCVAVCCSVLQCVAVCCSVLQCVADPLLLTTSADCTLSHWIRFPYTHFEVWGGYD